MRGFKMPKYANRNENAWDAESVSINVDIHLEHIRFGVELASKRICYIYDVQQFTYHTRSKWLSVESMNRIKFEWISME